MSPPLCAVLQTRLGPLTLRNPVMSASGTFGAGLEGQDFADLSGLGAPYVYQSSAEDNRELREIQVTVVARTRGEDPDVLANPALANNVVQAAGNRLAGVAPDGFRRRAVWLNVRPRNVNRLD